METVTAERVIEAPAEAVFDWISNAHNYTGIPLVLTERLATLGREAPYGTGAVRVLGWAVGWFWERITAYDPPHSFEYDVYRSIPPSRHREGRVTFDSSIGDDGVAATRVVWQTTFELSIPVIGGFLTRRVGVPLLTYAFRRILEAAERELVTERALR
ncbi:SRPBCC family protein [Gordonia sp. PKS22-38]|uniref:SRPBCC family protein n=1 Tax=Gordonia prachuapensis TaxID=3115651 RepID=A0ABU7MN93_9ACTN|nr:SRPBCC family protein [Gordonia sp. PKS22-38]